MRMETLSVAVVAALVAAVVSAVLGGAGGSVGGAATAAAEVVQTRPQPAAPTAPAAVQQRVRFVQIASAAWGYGWGYKPMDHTSGRDESRARVYLFGLCENGEVWAYTMEAWNGPASGSPQGSWNRVAMPR
jgi:hypothetical protein